MTTVTNDGLLALASRLGVQTLPLVLSVAPRQDSYDEWTAAQEQATSALIDSGLIDTYGEVDQDLVTALYVLAQPDQELVARVFSGDHALTRICLASRGEQHALAIRTDDTFDIREVWADSSGVALLRPVLDALGDCPPADVLPFSALAHELADRLEKAETSADFADAMYALGVPDRDATGYGMAFASCRAFAEIVVYAHVDGITHRPPGAVVVYDTGHGRIVAAPGIAPDQQVWSTLTPGTEHRVAQAISALMESLPGGRWLSQ